jgi:hypothetical protein
MGRFLEGVARWLPLLKTVKLKRPNGKLVLGAYYSVLTGSPFINVGPDSYRLSVINYELSVPQLIIDN